MGALPIFQPRGKLVRKYQNSRADPFSLDGRLTLLGWLLNQLDLSGFAWRTKKNAFSGTVTILPISSQNLDKIYPFEVCLPKGAGDLPKDSKVKADQIRTIDKVRMIRHIGTLRKSEIDRIEKAIRIHLEL